MTRAWVLGFCAVVSALACGGEPTPPVTLSLREQALAAGLAPITGEPVRPTDNPYVPARVELGHLLFFDPILSGPKDVACSTCHLPDRAFTDGRQFPVGAGATGLGPERTDPSPAPLRPMPRNSPPVFNLGFYGRMGTTPSVNATIFWGANAFGIEDQVLNPIAADNELRGLTYGKAVAFDSVVARLREIPEYAQLFRDAFPDPTVGPDAPVDRVITILRLRRALAAYLRELTTPNAPIDRFLAGDESALNEVQQAGLSLFIGKARCVTCHTGPLLSDFTPHVMGVAQVGLGRDTTPGDDLGWGEHGGVAYAFRTPPLRFITRSPPYFHDGVAETLLDVLRFKAAAQSRQPRVPQSALDPAFKPVLLTEQEMTNLLAFFEALDDPVSLQGSLFLAPARVPSGLPVPQ